MPVPATLAAPAVSRRVLLAGLTEELGFSRDSLLQALSALEEQLSEEVLALEAVRALSQRLESALSLEDVAATTAEAVSRALGGRAARVELADPRPGEGETIAALCPGDPASPPGRLVWLELHQPGLEVSVAGEAGLSQHERRAVSALLALASLAAHGQLHRLERDEAQHATVFALARLAERRDNETGQHLERVSSYCRLIALGLREDRCYAEEITDRFVSDLVRSAPLHDIGKVGIPDEILLKPGKLDAREWEIMRRHTTIGGDTLRSIIESTSRPGFLRLGHDVALYHHERWDGSGYPFGLAGAAIPLGARILALADVYDALTTRRPYKAPWPHARALEHIREERGKHFDPAVVDAFARRADEADRIRRLCPDEEPLESGV